MNPQTSWGYSSSMRLPQQGSRSSCRRCWRKLRSACSSAGAALRRAYPLLVLLRQAGNPPQPTLLLHRHLLRSASTSWQEAWPAKLSAERTAELRHRFEEDYPTELLDSEVFPSSRLLALTSKMVAEKEIRWLPWRFRLSAKAQDENLTRDIHDGPASYNMINQLLTLATNSIALCQGAHLGALKMHQKHFLRLCFTKYESASNLRGPTSLEAQSADKRAWDIIAQLVNQHAWKLDDALHETSGVRADLSSLLAPRATLPKQLLNHQETWRPRYPGRGRGGKAGGKSGKSKEDSRFAGGDRTERGGKGGKSGGKGKDAASPVSVLVHFCFTNFCFVQHLAPSCAC